MTITLFLLGMLLVWYVCGIINVALVQGVVGDDDSFSNYNRTTTLWFCYGLGPSFTLVILSYIVIIKPIKYGTRLGRWLGRKFED